MTENLDPISLYFKEIRKSSPLSHKEFLNTWKIFKTGEKTREKLEKIKNRIGLKKKKELQNIIFLGEDAKAQLIVGNLRLVVPIAKRYFRPGLDFIDLIEEGNIGLMHALKKFDAKKGFRFSTYASYWIDQSIRRSIEYQSKTIRIPPHAWEALRKWYREWESLSAQLSRNPTLTEMAQRLNLTARQVKGVMDAVEASRGIGSLDVSLDEDEDIALKDIISDQESRQPDQVFSVLKLHDEVESALSKLPKRERQILALRFGMDGEETLTLDEVGKKFKVSRERIRQIQGIALTNLKKIAQKMGLS